MNGMEVMFLNIYSGNFEGLHKETLNFLKSIFFFMLKYAFAVRQVFQIRASVTFFLFLFPIHNLHG